MRNVLKLHNRHWNSPVQGWLWVHDYPPDLVKIYFVISAICDWFFWHCFMHNYKSLDSELPSCSVRKACEMMDILNGHIETEFDQSNSLSELLWNHIDFPPFELLVDGAARDDRGISEISSSLFCWPPTNSAGALVLEEYFERIMSMRSHIFNQGNYHDWMNWLDIYDMELNRAYREWIASGSFALRQEIKSKLILIRRYGALANDKQAKQQWTAEAACLGLTESQTSHHWTLLSTYLLKKIEYHLMRANIIDQSLNSRFTPRFLYKGMDHVACEFSRTAINFSEERIELFQHQTPLQFVLF